MVVHLMTACSLAWTKIVL